MIETWARQPRPVDADRLLVAKYVPGQPLDDVAGLASRAAVSGFAMAEVQMPGVGWVLLVRWMHVPDDLPAREKFRTLKAGDSLASGELAELFVTSQAELVQWYVRVPRGY